MGEKQAVELMATEHEEFTVQLTREQIRILLSITGPRVADPDAERLGDWSVDLDRRLREAIQDGR